MTPVSASNNADAIFAAGCQAHAAGKTKEAVDLLEHCLTIDPQHAKALVELGTVMDWDLFRHDTAEKCYRLAIKIAPNDPKPYFHLAVEMMYRGEFTQSLSLVRTALSLDPADPTLWRLMANIAYELGDNDQALSIIDQLIASDPASPETLMQRATALLRTGKWEEGFRLYRNRHDVAICRSVRLPGRLLAAGESVMGKTILVAHEQGVGDTLNFLRYLPLLKEKGACVHLYCDPRLTSLLARNCVADRLFPQTEAWEPQEPFDRAIHLMDLPWYFGTTLDTVPSCEPRIVAPPEQIQPFLGHFRAGDGLHVGVAWQGNPQHLNDRRRSIPSDTVSALFDVPGVKFFSLQKGGDERRFAGDSRVVLWHDLLGDFDDTAGAVEALDLVISVDTSVAHLAGVMGKEIWLLLPYASEWRWLEQREDSVWYPSMRIIRQRTPGDWDEVLVRVKSMLQAKKGKNENIF